MTELDYDSMIVIVILAPKNSVIFRSDNSILF